MYTRKSNCNGDPQSTQALVYKGYVILLSKYDTCWGWSSDFSEGQQFSFYECNTRKYTMRRKNLRFSSRKIVAN